MDLLQAMRERRSRRAFRPDPVPVELIEQIIGLAVNAPSGNNLQPWEFTVVLNEERDRLSRTLKKAYNERQVSCGSGAVKPLPQVFRARGLATLEEMRPSIEKTGASVDDYVNQGSIDFYGAPAAIIISLDDCFSSRQLVDVGTALGYLVLSAHASGLATCPISLIAAYSDEIKELLNIPENKKVIIGIALGYADEESPVSGYRSSRESADKFIRWVD